MKAIGIDYGTKYVGISVSDPEQKVAFPRDKVELSKAITYIQKLYEEEDFDTVILGKPKSMKGTDTHMTREVEAFKIKLESTMGVKVIDQDERLTSKSVDKSLAFLGVNTKQRRGLKDALEATQILQSYLDTKNNSLK